MDERVNVKALFLGPKSENYSYFKEMLGYLMAGFFFRTGRT